MQMDKKIHVYEKNFVPRDCLPLPWGYDHVYDHNIQTSSLKPLGQSNPASLGRGNESLYKWSRSHSHHGY